MDIKDKLTQQEKQELGGLALQIEVLKTITGQKQQTLQNRAKELLAKAGFPPERYLLRFDVSHDEWEATLRENALVVPGQPNRAARRALGRKN